MKKSIITVAPTTEPVTLSECKAQLRIADEDTTYDNEINRMRATARIWVEKRYGISIITQTRQVRMDRFPSCEKLQKMRLTYGPVQSVTTVAYTDVSGNAQTFTDFASAGLTTPTLGVTEILRPIIYPNDSWPDTKDIPEAVRVTYVAGFGGSGQYVPQLIKDAILMRLTQLFENRIEEVSGPGQQVAKYERSIDDLMASFEVFEHISADD